MSKIKVKYDGKYPNTCSGTLKITEDGAVIYEKCFCCTSTGSVSFDADWNEEVTSGELLWNDAELFSLKIQKAVSKVLSKCSVCCGGCV